MRHFLYVFLLTTICAVCVAIASGGVHGMDVQDSTPLDSGEWFRKKGTVYAIKEEYDSAKIFYLQSLDYFVEQADSLGMGKVLNNLAYIATTNNHITEALSHYYRAIAIFKNIGEITRCAVVHINLAALFYYQRDYDQALAHYYDAQDLLANTDDKKRLANVGMGIGNVMSTPTYEGFDLKKANEAYLRSLAIYLEEKDSLNIAKSYNNIGRVYSIQGNMALAFQAYTNSFRIKKLLGDKKGQLIGHLNIGSILQKQEKLAQSMEHYERGAALAVQLGDVANYLHLLHNMVRATIALGMIDRSAILFKEYSLLQDSVFNEEKTKQIGELQTLYETEQKQTALLAQQQLNIQKTKQNNWLIALVACLVLILLLAWYINRKRSLFNKIVAENEREIIQLNAHIEGKENERIRMSKDLHDTLGAQLSAIKLFHSKHKSKGASFGKKITEMLDDAILDIGNIAYAHIEGKESERIRMSKYLHDKLGAQLSAIKLNHSQYENEGASNRAKVTGMLDAVILDIRKIAYNMGSATLNHFGLVIAIREYLEKLNDSGQIKAELMLSNMAYRLPEPIEKALYFVLLEFANNTLKHASATDITIQINRYPDQTMDVLYEDNGKGFDTSQTSKGMGLLNINARLSPFKATLEIDSKPEKGTSFILRFPKVV